MPQDPNMQAAQGGQPDAQGQGEPPTDDQQGPLTDMIVQTDQALSAIAQVLAKASPDASKAMMQVNDQFRKIIQSVMNQGQAQQGQGGQRPASPMVGPETQGKAGTMPAY